MFQRKNKYFHSGETNNEVEDCILFCKIFCSAKIRKHFELRSAIHNITERHFYNVKHVLYRQSLKYQAYMKACTWDRTPHMPKTERLPNEKNVSRKTFYHFYFMQKWKFF